MVAYRFLATSVAVVVATSSFVSSAGEPEAVVLAPADKWVLDMADNKCRLGRVFGEGKQRTAFYLEQWSPSHKAFWAVAGAPVERYRAGRKTSYSFGPSGDSDEFEFRETTFGDFGNQVASLSTIAPNPESTEDQTPSLPRGLATLDSEGAAGVEFLTIAQSGRPDVVLKLGDMQRPLAAMNVCMSNLVEHWGFSAEDQRRVMTGPEIGGLENVARAIQQAYPSAAERKGAQATFHIRLNIGVDGSIEECKLVNQTLADDFDMAKHPCEAFRKHAKIEPARDAEGHPVRSFYATEIHYQMGPY